MKMNMNTTTNNIGRQPVSPCYRLFLLFYFTLAMLISQGGQSCDAFALSPSISFSHSLVDRVRVQTPRILFRSSSISSSSSSSNNGGESESGTRGPLEPEPIDVAQDERLYRVRLSRATGIDWGTDLSFAFVYVRDLDPTGDAAASGIVQKGDQLCEMIPVVSNGDDSSSGKKPAPINLVGASFDQVMTSFAGLDRSVQQVDLVFFRGTKDDLKMAATKDSKGSSSGISKDTITVTVVQNKGSPEEKYTTLEAPTGTNIRQLLVDNGINPYQSISRWTNCKGKQLCGTCIVNIADGSPNTNWKSMDEASTLRANPESYRLSCVTFAHGDVLVETFPPIEPDQWTR